MKLIIIDRKAWERHCSEFADFIHSIEQLIGNPPETDEWLDNEAVCHRLGISKRTLQSYRDTGKIPFSIIGHKPKSVIRISPCRTAKRNPLIFSIWTRMIVVFLVIWPNIGYACLLFSPSRLALIAIRTELSSEISSCWN